MILKQYYLGCLAHASYLLGDEASGTAIVVDPQRVVIGGGFLRSPSDLCARVRRVFEQTMVFPPEVEPAHFHADSALVGAGALALQSGAAGPGRASP